MAGVAGVAGTATAVAVALVLTRARPPRAVGTDHAGTDPEPDLVDVLDRLGRDLRSGVGVTAAVTAALRDAPSLLPDVSHALAHQVTLASALDRQQPIGDEAALVLDGRYAATLAVGDNDAFAATWLLLDTFAPGSALAE